ncbi:carboxypeptidase-like regulatory domain-containing protein [Flavobacterium sp. RSB2_4_14]|uniref:carboxypeptidase-like regulatory domain-containing protein n=1 Tax=Flavobacterium sp. RSB2_4_14 TaxID=3447665 RepID=UPI003F2F2BC5
MTSKQEDELSMEIVLCNLLVTVPASITEQMPDFTILATEVSEKVTILRDLKQGQRLNRKGFLVTKINYREVMIDLGLNMAARVKAYALAEDDMVLWNEMDYKRYQFEKMRDSDVADECMSIFDRAEKLLSVLGTYGVTTDNLRALKASIDAYNEYLPLPRASVVNKKLITEQIKKTFAEITILLFKMDTLVKMLEFSEPQFYSDYFNSRKVIVTGGRVIALRGFITDDNGAALEKVVVTIADLKGFSTTSTGRGYYQFQNLPQGVFVVSFARAGYETVNVRLAITPTLRLDFDVVLKRVDAVGKVA